MKRSFWNIRVALSPVMCPSKNKAEKDSHMLKRERHCDRRGSN